MSERWDKHLIGLAIYHSKLSKDPSTRVGSVVVGPDREILSAGFNGFPRGIEDSPERLQDRDMKLKLVVHAEMNALLAAARTGVRLKGCTLYLAATDDTGMVWGGPPCTRCTVEIIQVGISEIVSLPVKAVPSRWHEDLKLARTLLEEARVNYREVSI
jgi:dCMP deaminase